MILIEEEDKPIRTTLIEMKFSYSYVKKKKLLVWYMLLVWFANYIYELLFYILTAWETYKKLIQKLFQWFIRVSIFKYLTSFSHNVFIFFFTANKAPVQAFGFLGSISERAPSSEADDGGWLQPGESDPTQGAGWWPESVITYCHLEQIGIPLQPVANLKIDVKIIERWKWYRKCNCYFWVKPSMGINLPGVMP